jgi:hypothetical protein
MVAMPVANASCNQYPAVSEGPLRIMVATTSARCAGGQPITVDQRSWTRSHHLELAPLMSPGHSIVRAEAR